MPSKILIIAGMHRSGTSVIAQWINKCGIHLGENFLGPDIGNAEGHFEDIDFVSLHERILQLHGLPDTGLAEQAVPFLAPNEWEMLSKLIREKCIANEEWGWKDPRSCLFLPFYRMLLPSAFYLIAFRDYRSVVSSLIQRDFQQAFRKASRRSLLQKYLFKQKVLSVVEFYERCTEPYLKVWIKYNELLLAHIGLIPENSYQVVSCDFLKDCGDKIFAGINRWGFTSRYNNFNAVYKTSLVNIPPALDGFIKDKLLIDKADFIFNEFRNLLLVHQAGISWND